MSENTTDESNDPMPASPADDSAAEAQGAEGQAAEAQAAEAQAAEAQAAEAQAAEAQGAEAAENPVQAEKDAHAAHEAHHPEHAAHGAMHVEVHPHVRWHADVLVDGHDIYHGFVKDVTDDGADLFLDFNLQYTRTVKLHIQVPPLSAPNRPHQLAASARVLSTVYDSDEECFRSALLFTSFEPQSERAFLHNRLE